MRLHVISLPHTQTTKAYSMCAYTEKVRKFCNMMSARGHEVLLYASEDSEADAKLVTCITREEQRMYGFKGPDDYLGIDFNDRRLWDFFNGRVIQELKERVEQRELICIITGTPAQPIAEAFAATNMTVEFGVGYAGIIPNGHHVFESYAWRNFVYGKYDMDGQFFDEVIPNYFEVEDFPLAKPQDYYLYIGRLTNRKGWRIAQEICQKLKRRLIVAGPGEFDGYGEYVGVVGPKERGTLMSQAKAVFVPTLYVGPFEGVSVEANLCGTPVITTDWGSFTENVEHGFNGFRCRMMRDFEQAADAVESLDRMLIRMRACSRFSFKAIAPQYERYFQRLNTLWGNGFYN